MKIQFPQPESFRFQRREFLSAMAAVFGAAALNSIPHQGVTKNIARPPLTVQQVIDLILAEIPGSPFNQTVDTLKSGKPDQVVTGIVATMFPTIEVIRKTIALKANFIIVHEPSFYNHTDETSWLEKDQVFQFKQDMLNKNGITIWRFHDYWHAHKPDGIQMGVLTRMGWTEYYNPEDSRMVVIPPTSLNNIILHAKKSLGIRQVRIIGDQKQICRRIGLMPGAWGGRNQIQLLSQENPDVVICGEVNEWETAEYVRDARAMGLPVSLIVLGHAESEEPGMEWLVPWLQPKVTGITVSHVPSHNPFMEV